MSAAHYARYFKPNPNETLDPSEQATVFNWTDIRTATLSFLDSIIIELCFPDSPYPKSVLFQILHDAVEESPREAKRFSQALWDAIGDLSVSHRLFVLAVLMRPQSDALKSWKCSKHRFSGRKVPNGRQRNRR